MVFLLFVGIPILELFLLLEVGSRIGTQLTVIMILVTGIAGWSLVKHQGLATLKRIKEKTAMGQVPAMEMVSGLCLLASGLLLITPGFLTDTVGFLLLVPFLRRKAAELLMKRFKPKVVTMGGGGGPRHYG